MADYAIGLSFHKAHRTLVRAVDLNAPSRYFATRSSAGFITLPTLATGDKYVEIQGIRQTSFQIQDNNQEFRLLGDDGWNDSIITGSGVQASVTAYFLKDAEVPGANSAPVFRGDYEEGFELIQRARYNKDYEIYIEFLKEMGQVEGTTGDFLYDFTGFNACIQNYQEQVNPEGLTEVSFDLMSRGRPVFGRYNAGGGPLTFGGVQSSLLFLEGGVRQATVVPANNSDGVNTGADITVTYTDGTSELAYLTLGQSDGSGFRLEHGSNGSVVPCTVSLSGAIVTINPDSSLDSGTIYRLSVADGAIQQAVDGTGTASANGYRTDIQGFVSTFRTTV